MTNIELKPVVREEIETVWKMQVEAFSELLERYQDYETSPATESMDPITGASIPSYKKRAIFICMRNLGITRLAELIRSMRRWISYSMKRISTRKQILKLEKKDG